MSANTTDSIASNLNHLAVNGETLNVSINNINTFVSNPPNPAPQPPLLGIENLELPAKLSTESNKNVSNLTTYSYTPQQTGTLNNDLSLNGYLKYITLDNGKVAPNTIQTPKGSLLMNNSMIQLLSNGINWSPSFSAGTNTNVWFPYQQIGSKLVVTDNIGAARIGLLSFSADGSTLAVGGANDNANIGATWIFDLDPITGTYIQNVKLIGTGYVGTPLQGSSVSLSADGNTLAVGGGSDNKNVGATWIFIRDPITKQWSQQGPKLVGTGLGLSSSNQGVSVSLSADGNTLAVGGNSDSPTGATWIFVRDTNSGLWSQQGSKLVGTGYTGGASQGTFVSLSADGNTLAASGPFDNASIGATWIFVRDKITNQWLQQGSKLVGTGNIGICQQGTTISLSSDGNTLAAGGSLDNSNTGAVWMFIRDNNSLTWSQQGGKLVSDSLTKENFGRQVVLSSNGNTLAVGSAGNTNLFVGGTWIFTRSQNRWSQQGSKLVGTGNVGGSRQGIRLAITAKGDKIATSGTADNSDIGAVWIFN